jgi:DNA-binding LacI/PurR family transcriptional regulator
MGTPTIRDVARAAGVSVATVSYVINDGPRPVTEETRRKILQTMQALDYEPNVSARRLRSQRTYVLGLAIAGMVPMPVPADRYFIDVLRGVSVGADQHGYDLMLFSQAGRILSDTFYPILARKRMLDGLIVSGSRFHYRSVTAEDEKRLPVVVVGRQLTGTKLRRVVFNYEEDAYQVTRTLIGMGHRRIALLLNTAILSGENERLKGYQRALEEAGLLFTPALINMPEQFTRYPSQEVVLGMIHNEAATALICGPYVEVCEFVSAAGYTNRVAVATLDEEVLTPRPAALAIGVLLDKYQAGLKSVNMLMEVIKGNKDLPEQIVVPSKMTVYETSAASDQP